MFRVHLLISILDVSNETCSDRIAGFIRNLSVSLFCLQGMNFIAGYLLIVTKDEEKSFWLMDALLGRILPGAYECVLRIIL